MFLHNFFRRMNQQAFQDFGPHLTLDGKRCDTEALKDLNLVYNCLNELPSLLGMEKMTLPYVVPWKDKFGVTPGVSGFVMIAESHISIHTFPDQDYVFIDIFSCKPFDIEKAIRYFADLFGIKEIKQHVVERGLNFPRNYESY